MENRSVLSPSRRAKGKRPAEFADNPRYELHGDKDSRFTTVIDKETGKVECFFDREPGYKAPWINGVPGLTHNQIDDVALTPNDLAFHPRGHRV